MAMTELLNKRYRVAPDLCTVDKQSRYEAAVQDTYRTIYRYAYWLCLEQKMTEELVHATYREVWHRLDSLKNEASVILLLISILRMEYTKRLACFDCNKCDEKYCSSSNSEQHMLQQQIMILPLEYREPLVLSLMVGLNNAQISEVLGISANTVETRLFNARIQLKKQLDDHALATLTCSSATPSV